VESATGQSNARSLFEVSNAVSVRRRPTYRVRDLSPSRPCDPGTFPAVAVLLAVNDTPVAIRDQSKYSVPTEAQMFQDRRPISINKDISPLNKLDKLLPPVKCLEVDIHADFAYTAVDQGDRQLVVSNGADTDNRGSECSTDSPNRRGSDGASELQHFETRERPSIRRIRRCGPRYRRLIVVRLLEKVEIWLILDGFTLLILSVSKHCRYI
jgi:hypothetical protein